MTTILYQWGLVRWMFVLSTMVLNHWPLMLLFSCAPWRIPCTQDHHRVCVYVQCTSTANYVHEYILICATYLHTIGTILVGSMVTGTNVHIHMAIDALLI